MNSNYRVIYAILVTRMKALRLEEGKETADEFVREN
jgi:hypothetical protein